MEGKESFFKVFRASINKYLISSSKFSFYYILPLGLGFITAITLRDSQTISYKKRLMMALASYYEKTNDVINHNILKEYPMLPEIIERGRKFELKNNDVKDQNISKN